MYAIANVPTAIRDSLDFLKTDAIILTLFEYLNILNALKTLNALAILKILKSLNPLFKTDIDGKIDTISIIAKIPNGYRIKETKDFLSKGKSTPFENARVLAKCVLTVKNGKIIFNEEEQKNA